MSDSATNPSARLEERDLQRVRHLLGGALMLVALWGLALVDTASPETALAALAAVFAGLCVPGRLAARGERFWTIAGWGVVALALADLAFTAATDRSRLIPAVIRVALYIAVLRTLQPRTRREDMQLILLALFLCAVGGALSLSPLFAVQVALFIPLAGGILFLLNRLDGAASPRMGPEDWKNFRFVDFARRVRASLTPGTLAFLASLFVAVGLLGAVIFTILPRYRMDRAMPFLQLPGKGRTGFSDTVTLGGIGEMQQDETVALRADTPGRKRPVAPPYWRMTALDAYTSNEASGGFALSPGAERFFRETPGRCADWTPAQPAPVGPPGPYAGEWSVFMEGNVSRYLPAPGVSRRIRFDKPQEWNENSVLRTLRLRETPSAGVPMRITVSGDSARLQPARREHELLTNPPADRPGDYPATLLGLPKDDASREALRRALREMGAQAEDPPGVFAEKASVWLHRRHAYALSDGYGRKTAAPGEPADYLVRWMHSEATGWCEHFACSFTLLARAAGHPARLVTGFSGGEWNDAENYLVVRMKHGHAWVELYDRAAGVWLRVDPTPAGSSAVGGVTAAAREGLQAFAGLRAWYDSLTMLWFRRVVNFEERDQREAFREAGDRLKEWRAAFAEGLRRLRTEAMESLKSLREAPARLAGPAAAVALGALALRALLHLARKLSSARVRRAHEDDPRVRRYRERAARALARLDRAANAGRSAPPGVRSAVETLRYGRPSEWPEPESALDAARRWR